jgi:hypothetical protein
VSIPLLPVLFFGAVVLVVILVVIFKRRKRDKKIASILAGENVLARWPYAPDEWQKAAGEEFDWVKHRELPGQAFFTPTALYITNGSEQFFRDLSELGKKVTHCSYRGTPGAVLKMRVRWKVRTSSATDYSDKTHYYKEDYRVPVPHGHEEQARRVVEHFAAQIEADAAAIQDVMPEDSPISLFGKDEF